MCLFPSSRRDSNLLRPATGVLADPIDTESKAVKELKITALALAIIAVVLLGVGSVGLALGMSPAAIQKGLGFLYSFTGTHMAALGALVFVASVGVTIAACCKERKERQAQADAIPDL